MSTNPSEIKINTEVNVLEKFLSTPFIIQDKLDHLAPFVRLSLGPDAERVTAHYNGHFPVPRTPLFHPYDPNDNLSEIHPTGITHTVLALKCPKETLSFLPDNLKKLLADSNINPNQIEISVISQSMPWTNVQPLLMRPHYWIHGDPQLDNTVKTGGALNTVCEVAVCTTRPESTILCDGFQNIFPSPPKLLAISTHGTVCSPGGIGVLSGVSRTQSSSFFSLIKAADGRVALTLHWLLCDQDHMALERAASKLSLQQEKPTLRALMFHIAQHIPTLIGPLEDLTKLFNTALHKLHPPVLTSYNMQPGKKYIEVAALAQNALDIIAATRAANKLLYKSYT